jgi:hypothetical protein
MRIERDGEEDTNDYMMTKSGFSSDKSGFSGVHYTPTNELWRRGGAETVAWILL